MVNVITATAKKIAEPAAEPWVQFTKAAFGLLLLSFLMAVLFSIGWGHANVVLGFLALIATTFFLLQPYNVTLVGILGLIGAVFSNEKGAFAKARSSVTSVSWAYIQAVCWILMLIAFISAVFSFGIETETTETSEQAATLSVWMFIFGFFRLLLIGAAALAMSVAFEMRAGNWKKRIGVTALLLVIGATIWFSGGNILYSKLKDEASNSEAPTQAVSSGDSTEESSDTAQVVSAAGDSMPSCTEHAVEEYRHIEPRRFAAGCQLTLINLEQGGKYGALTPDGRRVASGKLYVKDAKFVHPLPSERLLPTPALEAIGGEVYIFTYPEGADDSLYEKMARERLLKA